MAQKTLNPKEQRLLQIKKTTAQSILTKFFLDTDHKNGGCTHYQRHRVKVGINFLHSKEMVVFYIKYSEIIGGKAEEILNSMFNLIDQIENQGRRISIKKNF